VPAIVAFDDITMDDMGVFWRGLDSPKLETGTKYHYTGFGLVAPSRLPESKGLFGP
jgi:hypothetical protein